MRVSPEDPGQRWLLTRQGARPPKVPHCRHLDLGLSSHQNDQNINLCCLTTQSVVFSYGCLRRRIQEASAGCLWVRSLLVSVVNFYFKPMDKFFSNFL